MTYNANPPEEFVRANPRINKFEVMPLDVELAKLVFAMTKRLPAELPAEGKFQPIAESYQPTWISCYSKLGLIELACQAGDADGERVLTITFWNQQHTTPYRYLLAHGTAMDMLKFIVSTPSLYHCKGCALWTDSLLKAQKTANMANCHSNHGAACAAM